MRQAILLLRAEALNPIKDRPSWIPEVKSHANASTRVNLFRDKLFSGHPVIAVELDPPMDADVTYLLHAARKVKEAGADIVTIADQYRKVALWSAEAARRDYLALMPAGNPQSPLNLYPRGMQMRVTVESV